MVRFVAWSFLCHPLLLAAFVVVVNVGGDGRATDFGVIAPVFIPGMLVVTMSILGWFVIRSEVEANPSLDEHERARWRHSLAGNPYATIWYWWRVRRGQDDRT